MWRGPKRYWTLEYMNSAVVKNTWTSYNSTNGYYTNSNWNSNLNWVVLAVCNQLTTNDNRNEWAKAMAGTHRVKGLMGYMAKAPVIDDEKIASKFVDLCFNSTSKRPIYAWVQANNYYGQGNSAALFHSVNQNDTLTNITNNTIYMVPTYNLLTSDQSIIQDPFHMSTFTNNFSLQSTDLTSDVMVPEKVAARNIETFSETDDSKVKSKYKDVKFDIRDHKDVSNKVTAKMVSDKIIPSDAQLCAMYPIYTQKVSDNGALGEKIIDGYILNYGHAVDGQKISSSYLGDFANVCVDKDGIFSIEKKWSQSQKLSENKVKAIDANIIQKKAIEYLNTLSPDNKTDIIIKTLTLNYLHEKEDSNNLVPAYVITFENGIQSIHINAISGEIIK